MSFQTFMKPLLNNPSSEDGEWYVKATHQCLNNYMAELESALSMPNQMVTGTIVTPSVPPVTTVIEGNLAYFIPTGQRFTYDEVKGAMFCGNSTLTFINLFNLFGQKFALNFINMQALPVLAVEGICTLSTASFTKCANDLMSTARSIGRNMTPETFLSIESNYLQMAIKTIPPAVVTLIGAGLTPVGTWAGTANVSFSTLGV